MTNRFIRNLTGISAISGLALVLACGGSDDTSKPDNSLTPSTPVITGPTTGIGGHRYILNAFSTDPGGKAITFSATTSNGQATATGNTISYTPNANYNNVDVISITAKNSDNASSPTVTYSFDVKANRGPQVPSIAIEAGGSATVTLPTTDPDGDDVTWAQSGTKAGTFITAGGDFTYDSTANRLRLTVPAGVAQGNYTITGGLTSSESGNGIATTITSTPTLNVTVGAASTQPDGEASITTELPNNLMDTVQGLANHQAFWARTSTSGTVNATKWDVKAGVGPDGPSLNGTDFEAWISTNGNQMPTTAQGYSDIFINAVAAQNADEKVSVRPFGELWIRPRNRNAAGTEGVAVGDTTKWLTIVAEFEDTHVKTNKSWRINIGENAAPTLVQGGTPTINTTVKAAPWKSGQDDTFTTGKHIVFQSTKPGSAELTYKIVLPTGADAPTVTDINFPAGDRVSVDLVDIKLGSTSIKTDFLANWNKGTVLTLDGTTKTGDTTRAITGPIEFQVPLDTYTGVGNDLVFTYKVSDGAGLTPGSNYTITLPTAKNPEPIIDAFDANDNQWAASSADMRSVNGLTGWVSSQPSAGQTNQWTILHNGATPQKLRVANPIPTASPAISTAWSVYMRTNSDNLTWPVVPTTLVPPEQNWTIDWTPIDPTDARTQYSFTLNAWNQYGAKGEPFTMSGQVWGRVIGEPVSKKLYLALAADSDNNSPVMTYPANFSSWADLKIAPRFDSNDALYPNQYGFDPGDPLNPPGYWNVEKKPGSDVSAWRSSAVPPGYYLISARDFDIVGQNVINPIIGPAIAGTYVTNPANPFQVPRVRPTYAYIQNDAPDLTTHVPYGALAGAIDTSITYNVNGPLTATPDLWYPGYWVNGLTPVYFTAFDDANDPDYDNASFEDWYGNEAFDKLDDVKFSGAMTLVGEGDLTGKGGVIQFVFRDASQKAFFDVVKQEDLPEGLDRYPVEAYDKIDFTWTGKPGFATEVRVDPSDGGLSYRNIAFTLGNVGTGDPGDYDADLIGSGPLAYKTYATDKLTLLAMKREPSAITGLNYWRASRTAAPAAIPAITGDHGDEVKLSSSFAPTQNGGQFSAIINRNSFIADLPFINGTNIPATTLKDTLQVVAYTSGTELGPVDNINGLPTLIEFGQLAGNAGIPANFTGSVNLGTVTVPRPDRDYWYGESTPVVHYTINYNGTLGLPGSMGVATTKLNYTSSDPLSRGLAPITNVKITTKAWDANKSTIDASSSPITVYKPNSNSTSGTNITATVAPKAFNNDGQDFHTVWLTWKNPKDNTGRTLNSGTIIEIFDLSDDAVEAAGGSAENVAPLFKVHVAPEVEEFPIPNAWVAALSGSKINEDGEYEYDPENYPEILAADPANIVIRMRAVRYGDEAAGTFVNFDKSPFKQAFPAYWIDTITSRLDFTDTGVGKITVWDENMTVNLNHDLTGTYSNGPIQLRTDDPHDNNLHFTVDGSTAKDTNGSFTYTWTLKSVTPDAAFVGTPTADNQMRNLFQFVGTGAAGDGSDGTTNRYKLETTDLTIPQIQISTVGAPFLANAKSANLVLTLTIRKDGTTTDNVVDVPVSLEAAWWSNPSFTLNPTRTVGNTITNYATDLATPGSPKAIVWGGATPLALQISENASNVTPGTTGLTYKWEIVPGTVAAFTGASATANGTQVNTILTAQTDVVLVPSIDVDKGTQSTMALPGVYIINNNNHWTTNPSAITVNRVTFNIRCQVYWNGQYLGTTTNNLPVDFRPAAAQNPWSTVRAIQLSTSNEDDHGTTCTIDVGYNTPLTSIPTVPEQLLVSRATSGFTWETTGATGANLVTLASGGDFGARWVMDGKPIMKDADGNVVNIDWDTTWITGLPSAWAGVDVSQPGPITLATAAKTPLENADVRMITVNMRYEVKPTTGSTPTLTSINTYTLNLIIPMKTLTVSDWSTVASVSFPVGATAFGHLETATVQPVSDPVISFSNLIFKNAAGNPLTGMASPDAYLWTVVSAQGYGETGAAVGSNARNSFTVLEADKDKVAIPQIVIASAATSNANITKYVVGLNLKVTSGGKNLTTTVPLEVTFGPDMSDVVSIEFPDGTSLAQTATNEYKTAVAAVPTGLTLPRPSDLVILNGAGKNIANAMQLEGLTYTWVADTANRHAFLNSTNADVDLPAFAWDSDGEVTAAFPSLAIPSLKWTEKTTSDFPTVVNKVTIPMNLKVDDGTDNVTTTTPIVITFNTIAP